jgi:hypothetical protein
MEGLQRPSGKFCPTDQQVDDSTGPVAQPQVRDRFQTGPHLISRQNSAYSLLNPQRGPLQIASIGLLSRPFQR